MLKKISSFIRNRLFMVSVLLIFQIIILFLAINKFEEYGLYFSILFFILSILVLLKIINGNANPNYKIAWIIPVLTIPVLSSKLNNRDHRKITVIDGKIAFTGGVNLADEYINEIVKHGHWKDNGILIKGDAVWTFVMIFLSLWNNINNKKEQFLDFKPDLEKIHSKGFVQPYDDTALDNERVSETICLNLINKAEKYIYITTPYLILDDEIETALCIAAKSGIDVRIITPGIPDKKIVNEVTKAYYNNLLENGVKIYEYTKGFIHAKTFLVDDQIATVGTVNLDYRSLCLHFECGVLMFKTNCIEDIKKDLEETFNNSKPILIKDVKVGLFKSLKRAILRLFAPLM